jgi:hypothetical protein
MQIVPKRKPSARQQLQKAGVLSKVEAERAELQANRAVYRFSAGARERDAQQVESIRARVAKGEASNDLLFSAEAALKNSEALATEADALLAVQTWNSPRINSSVNDVSPRQA